MQNLRGQDAEEMLPEYDFSQGVRGRYAPHAAQGVSVVLAPDVAEVFPDSASVNEALRVLAIVARKTVNPR